MRGARMQYSRRSVVCVLTCLPFAHFAMSAAVAQQPEISKYGAWETQCVLSPSGVRTCALVQRARAEEQPKIGLMVAVRKVADMPNGMIQIFAPPKMFLLEDVGIKIDSDELGRLPYFRCTEITCTS
ncbi:invasion associated locus B family protein [Methylocystis sp. H62]|uniref:invasion associated locus B family protein n=1 Tax=Methylocystis sp. H62 TaxID=2785789 RepID=UPI0039175A1B